jgi:AcrR family transcriptional regulator
MFERPLFARFYAKLLMPLHIARTPARILEAAGSHFLTDGLTDPGLARVMKAAGLLLTHGGFYRRFASQDELVAEAYREAFSSRTCAIRLRRGAIELDCSAIVVAF